MSNHADQPGPSRPAGPAGQPHTDPYGLPPRPPNPYASWIKRVGAYLIDSLLVTVAYFPAFIGMIVAAGDGSDTAGAGLTVVGAVLALAVFVWNTCLRAGRTGYSVGKSVIGIKLVGLQSGQPIGAGRAFLRYLCHIVDAIPLYLGYLWPLWDPKRQTFSDKIMRTVVLVEPPR